MSLPQIAEIKDLNNEELRQEIFKLKKNYLIYALKQLVNRLIHMRLNMQMIYQLTINN